MLSRRREQMVLLLGLIVLNAVLAWDVRRLWRDYQQRMRWIDTSTVIQASPMSAAKSRNQLPAQNFAEIVDRNMFTQERTSRSPKDEAKAPELPSLDGTMNIGEGWFALMAPGEQAVSGPSKRINIGEEIGGYRLVSISGSRVVVEWQGKTFNIDTVDSVRRAARNVASTVRTETAARAATGSTSSPPHVTMVGTPASGSTSFPAGARGQGAQAPGTDVPRGAPADAPPGTVIGGKRKVVNPTPFGDQVFWVDADQPAQGDKKDQ